MFCRDSRMDVNAREVEDAVNEFYKNPTGKNDIHNWLTQAQHSTYAWTFAFQLLDRTKVSLSFFVFIEHFNELLSIIQNIFLQPFSIKLRCCMNVQLATRYY